MRDSLKPVMLTGSIIYLVALVTTAVSRADSIKLGIFLAFVSALYLSLYLVFTRVQIPLTWVNLLVAIIAGISLFTCVLFMYAKPEPRHTTSFMLLIVGAGALVLSTQWLMVFVVATCLSWFILALNAPPSSHWPHFGFSLFVATTMAITIHIVRVRALRNLEILRIRNQARKDMLEVALLAVRLREEEVKMLNEQLENRVVERTAELRSSEERNRSLLNDLHHVARVATMGELAASIAHEVNQPLCAIINNAAYCNRWLENSATDHADLEEMREAMNDITESSRRASEVIQRIRTMVRKGEAEPVRLDVNELIRQVVALMRNEALKRSVNLKTELAETLPQTLGDRVQLQQVVLNLIINGFDAMHEVEPAKRELCIRSRFVENNMVLIEVSDTGMGINQSNSQKIFDAFFTTKSHGMGMGLSICQTIIRSHGGRLWVAEEVEVGATFRFTLPMFEESQDD
ncbi:MAG TPA: ATP-binding protein [Blastocatellia bacterium]|nr:ATP-binding protein [Blastocatellia bacterium]